MLILSKFLFLCSIIFLINLTFSQQYYDRSDCSTESPVHGYICSSNDLDCETFLVYRAQQTFNSVSSIASLFSLSQLDLLAANHLKENDSRSLSVEREIIIPISCQCRGGIFHAPFIYNISSTDSVNAVACEVFEGLVKARSLIQENPGLRGYHPDGYLMIKVHIQCACPNSNQRRNGVNYLVTYPILEGDYPDLIAHKFNISWETITDANNLGFYDAIYPNTTLLIPTNNVADVNWEIDSVPQNSPGPEAAFPLKKVMPVEAESTEWNSNLHVGAGVSFAVITMVVACGVFINIRRKKHPERLEPLSARISMSSNVSPDFLDGVSKLKNSLIRYSSEEIWIATEASMISKNIYRGRIGDSYLALIEQTDSEEAARNVIYILTKINHFNIVRLQGFCKGMKPYLVLEYAENGSLRNCLSNLELNRQLTWARRLQIAFDLAAALHYLHNFTAPAFVHRNINSNNVLLNIDWRAKISGFSSAKPVTSPEEKGKEDVFAFGIVLLELVSAKEIVTDDKILTDSVNFLLDGKHVESSTFLQKLREFMDSVMEGKYSVGDAICLVLLAKSCIEEDPDHRPTMNDILISLSRIL